MSDLKTRIFDDVKSAMRARQKDRLEALRMITAALKQREVDERVELDDAGVLAVLEKMLKQRRDSLAQFESAGRDDLAGKERFEIEIIDAYMPTPLSESELQTLLDAVIAETGASGMRDMGKVMAQLKPRVQGRADMGALSAAVKRRLNG